MRRQRTRTTDVKSTIAVYITRNRTTSPKNIVAARSGQSVDAPDSGIGGDKSFEQIVIFLQALQRATPWYIAQRSAVRLARRYQ
jgi:hypothetical protein